MINSITVTNHIGESLLLELRSPERSGFFIKSIDGLGPTKSTINTTEVLSSDGSFYNSSRLASRNLVFNLGFYNDGTESIEEIRKKTYRFFPMKRLITVAVNTDSRVGTTMGYVESNEPDIFSKDEGAIISIICPSAFFLGDVVDTYFTGVSSAFQFPWENPSLTLSLIEFGSIFIDTQKTVLYTGDDETGVVVYIFVTGNVGDVTVYNATLSQQMTLSGSKISLISGSGLIAGDLVIISTVHGSKYITLIRNGISYNILNALSTNAKWLTIQHGDNVFTYTATSGLSNMQFLIEHRILYGGL